MVQRKGIRNTRSDQLFDVVIYILGIFLLLLCLYPIWFVLIASVSEPAQVGSGNVILWPGGFQLNGYRELLGNNRVWLGYRNTIFYTVIGTLIILAVNIPAGYALSCKKLVGSGWFVLFFMVPMFFSGGLIPTYMLVNSLGMVDSVWAMFLPGCVIAHYMIVARTFFSTTIPADLREAAELDGCGDFRYFFQIVLPLSKAIIAVLALWSAVAIWNSYYNALVYLRSEDKQPLQIFLRNILISNQSMSKSDGSALEQLNRKEMLKYCLIVVSSAPIVGLYPFVQKYFNQGVMVGAVKG